MSQVPGNPRFNLFTPSSSFFFFFFLLILIVHYQFIQTMSDDLKIVVSKKRESCTKNVQACNAFEVDGRTVELVDTPGFSDSKMTDTQVLEKIATWLKEK